MATSALSDIMKKIWSEEYLSILLDETSDVSPFYLITGTKALTLFELAKNIFILMILHVQQYVVL